MQITTKQGLGKDPLLQLFDMLWDSDKVFLTQLASIVDEIQRCVDHDPGQKGRVTSYVVQKFSDLALISQLVGQVKTFFPWSAGLKLEMSPEARSPGYDRATTDAATVFNLLREDIAPKFVRAVVPLSKHLHYSIEKACNETSVKACQQVEERVDRLCKVIDEHCRKHTNKTLHEIFPQPRCESSRGPSRARIDASPEALTRRK